MIEVSTGLTARFTFSYKQLGNAVAVPVVEWIMRRLVAVDAAERAAADEVAVAA